MYQYEDFDLYISEQNGSYRVCVNNPLAGQEAELVILPVDNKGLGTLIQQNESEILTPQEIGEAIYRAFFPGKVAEQFAITMYAAQQDKHGVRLRLHLDDTPQLARLPWEYLYHPVHHFIALSHLTPIVRYLHVSQPEVRPAITGSFNILVILSSPTDHAQLDVDDEWQRLTQEFEPLIKSKRARLERLCPGNGEDMRSSLLSRLRRRDLHAIHFVGHGDFAENGEYGYLCFEDKDKLTAPVTADDFALLLKDYQIQLVYLNTCRSGLSGMSNPFAGVAQQLVQINVPAVVAMSMPVSDKQSRRMAGEFYRALVRDNYPVDAALAEARKAICHNDEKHEWGKLVLFMRSSDGRLFDLHRPTADEVAHMTITAPEYQLCRRLADLLEQADLATPDLRRLIGQSCRQKYEPPIRLTGAQAAVEQLWEIRDEQNRGMTIIEFAERLSRHGTAIELSPQIQLWIKDALANPDLNMTQADWQRIVTALAMSENGNAVTESCYLLVCVRPAPNGNSAYLVDAWTQLSNSKPEYQVGIEGDRNNQNNKTYKREEIPGRLFGILEQVSHRNIHPDIIEVFLPIELFDQDVDQWSIQFKSGFDDLPHAWTDGTEMREILCREYHVVIRCAERAFKFAKPDQDRWVERWNHLMRNGTLLDDDRLFLDDDKLYYHATASLDHVKNLWNYLVSKDSKKRRKRCAGFKFEPVTFPIHLQALKVSLKSGLPILLWPRHCYCEQKSTHEQAQDLAMLEELVKGSNGLHLPRVVSEKLRNCKSAWDHTGHLGNHLTLLYDDPTRIPELPPYLGESL